MPFARFFAYFHGLGNVYVSVRFLRGGEGQRSEIRTHAMRWCGAAIGSGYLSAAFGKAFRPVAGDRAWCASAMARSLLFPS
ncbi:hypothetical protein ACKZDW_24565 [Ralstonia syzygii subsp. celebesensis]